MIKLIVSDIDGTLVPDGEHDIFPEYFDVIKQIREQGIQFAAASGRQWPSIELTLAPVKEKIFYIADGGAFVGCTGRTLYSYAIDQNLLHEVLGDILAQGLTPMLSSESETFIEYGNEELYRWLTEGYCYRVRQFHDLREVTDPIIKIAVYQPKTAEESTAGLRKKYGSRLKMVISGDMWMDASRIGVSKGQAVKLLQEALGITPKETMVFGDQLNDLDMLAQAYYSFAVGNARPEVRAAARFQADTVTNHGPLKIMKLVLQGKL